MGNLDLFRPVVPETAFHPNFRHVLRECSEAVRKRVPDPLANPSFNLNNLSTMVPPQKRFEAVGFLRKPGTIPQSFAWVVCGDFVMWGIADTQGRILRLCVSGIPSPDKATEISATF